MMSSMATPEPATDRVRLRRGAALGDYDRAAVLEVLDAGLIAHVGVTTPDGPIVLPMAYGRSDEWLYVHGSVANAALRAAVGRDVCITVTILDGMIVGRCPFHNSMNYRAVVVRGTARKVDDPDEHVAALRLVSDHIVPTWDTRASTDSRRAAQDDGDRRPARGDVGQDPPRRSDGRARGPRRAALGRSGAHPQRVGATGAVDRPAGRDPRPDRHRRARRSAGVRQPSGPLTPPPWRPWPSASASRR